MKLFKIINDILLSISITSFGFSKLNQNKSQFKFQNINVNGNKRIVYILKNNIALLSNNNAEKIFDLEIDLKDTKASKLKDKSGKTTRFTLLLTANFKLTKYDNLETINRSFTVSTDYEVSNKHSITIRNEQNSRQTNIDKLSEDCKIYTISKLELI